MALTERIPRLSEFHGWSLTLAEKLFDPRSHLLDSKSTLLRAERIIEIQEAMREIHKFFYFYIHPCLPTDQCKLTEVVEQI